MNIISHSPSASGSKLTYVPNHRRVTYFDIIVDGYKLQMVVLEDKNGVITFDVFQAGYAGEHATLLSLFRRDSNNKFTEELDFLKSECNHVIQYVDMNGQVLMIPATLFSDDEVDENGYPCEVYLKLTLDGVDFVFECL